MYWKYCIIQNTWQIHGKSNHIQLTMMPLVLIASHSPLRQAQVELIAMALSLSCGFVAILTIILAIIREEKKNSILKLPTKE
jgi:hypothetical protein